jgi:hypothetical protein
LQIDAHIVSHPAQLLPHAMYISQRSYTQWLASPLLRRHNVHPIHHGHLWTTHRGVFSRQQTPPLRLDRPTDKPFRMRHAQGCDRWQRVENIAHRAQPHDEYT